MRRSHKTNTLVLIFDHTMYDDNWEDNVLHYTGMEKIETKYLMEIKTEHYMLPYKWY